jgi:predicted nucleic acid-binding protein
VVYLDSSAIVKLIIAEPESAALRRYLRRHTARASCSLAKVEVTRAVHPHGAAALTRARQVLRRVDLVQLDDELLDDATTLEAGILRSLDAIHLAAARVFDAATREFAVRMAIGASATDVTRLVIGGGLRHVCGRMAVGVAASIALAPLVKPMLFDVPPSDVASYAATLGVLLVVSLVATYMPARRAVRVNPIVATQEE